MLTKFATNLGILKKPEIWEILKKNMVKPGILNKNS